MIGRQVAAKKPLMWPYYPDLLATPVPRYTSFPTAAEFGETVGHADADAALRETSGDVSLYVHIPFCERICWYCGCNTGAVNRRERLANYLDSLHREIALTGPRLSGRTSVRRIAFGGGSPNAISPTDFVRLVDALTLQFSLVEPVWSIELDPRSLVRDWLPVMAAVGIQRASMGVQTLSPALQQAIGRVQPEDDIIRGVELLREAGVASINFDLMYGLPGQTLADLEHSLMRSVAMGADRIALFGYAHVPQIIPRQQRIAADHLPDQQQRFAMAQFGYDVLTAAGYEPIGFDHFALPGDAMARARRDGRLHRNFQGFTEDEAPTLIGLGASAIGSFAGALLQNEKNAGRYRMLLSQDRLPVTRGLLRSAADASRGRMLEALLCHDRARLDESVPASAIAGLAPFLERGLAALDGDILSILPAGLPYARTIAALFDPYRQESVRRFSSAV